ncbi:MAG: hypothetical protein JWQ14_2916 [Adhaeribacter sp.]|nr:hypothetical protein [Adhaeribacter sp.]
MLTTKPLTKLAIVFLLFSGLRLVFPIPAQAALSLNISNYPVKLWPWSADFATELRLTKQTLGTDAGAAIRNLEKLLLSNIYISQITPADMLAAYSTFVQNLIEQSPAWTATDWENAEHILNKLHFRRKVLQEKIPAEDKVTITALQMQYRALKTGKQAHNQVN